MCMQCGQKDIYTCIFLTIWVHGKLTVALRFCRMCKISFAWHKILNNEVWYQRHKSIFKIRTDTGGLCREAMWDRLYCNTSSLPQICVYRLDNRILFWHTVGCNKNLLIKLNYTEVHLTATWRDFSLSQIYLVLRL